MSGRHDMGEDPNRDVEERLRAALRDRSRDFTASLDAWQRTLARRATRITQLRITRPRLHVLAPLAAAAVVVTLAIASVLGLRAWSPARENGVTGKPGPSGTPAAASGAPATPRACPTPAPLPSAIPALPFSAASGSTAGASIARVSPADLPPVVLLREAIKGYPPATAVTWAILRFDGQEITVYTWFSRSEAHLGNMVTVILSPGHHYMPVAGWQQGPFLPQEMRSGVVSVGVPGTVDNGAFSYTFGYVTGAATAVTAAPSGGKPVPGLIVGGPGLPYRVWVAAFPSKPYEPVTLVFRGAAGQQAATTPVIADQRSGECYPLYGWDFRRPSATAAYIVGTALTTVASVTAVLPDGTQVKGRVDPHELPHSPGLNYPFRQFGITLPPQDANVSVTVVFRDAKGHVLRRARIVPGKNPIRRP